MEFKLVCAAGIIGIEKPVKAKAALAHLWDSGRVAILWDMLLTKLLNSSSEQAQRQEWKPYYILLCVSHFIKTNDNIVLNK